MEKTTTKLESQVALVTGGSRGIGLAVARSLSSAGAQVVALGRGDLDVRSVEQVEKVVAQTLERFGRIDILVNNAGLGHFGPVDELPIEKFDEMIAVNLRGPFLLTRAVVPAMKRQGSGVIVNVASVAGIVGNPNLSGYNASKFGLMGFSESTMLELRHAGIKVAVICPGSVATDFGHGPNVPGMLDATDVALAVMSIVEAAPNALISQIHLRPLRPPKR